MLAVPPPLPEVLVPEVPLVPEEPDWPPLEPELPLVPDEPEPPVLLFPLAAPVPDCELPEVPWVSPP
jgi:hypothetical protein